LEVDLLIEKSNQLIAIEARSGMTFIPSQLDGLQKLSKTIMDLSFRVLLVYGGEDDHKIEDITILSWRKTGLAVSEIVE
jgi:hypothetical protein